MLPILLDTSGWATSFAKILTSGFSWLYNMIATLITYLFNFLFAIVLQVIVRVSAGFLYTLLHILLAFVDLFEDVFNIFAGTRTITYNNEKMYFFDLFMVDGTVQRALIYITFIGVALCFIFTIYSVVKSMGSYILENKRPVSEVLKTAMKSCIAFLMVPIMAYFGIQLSSVILTSTERAIMQSTGTDSSPRMAYILFLSGTFNDDDPDASYTDELRAPYFYGEKKPNDPEALNDFTMMPTVDIDGLVNYFKNLTKNVPNDAKGEAVGGSNKISESDLEKDSSYNDSFNISDVDADENYNSHQDIIDVLFKDLYNYPLVYLLSIGMIIIMLCSMFVFIRKIIELIILYVTSPIFVSTMPLDGGAIFKRWRDMFIGKLFSGFGIVISMKLVMIFVPIIMGSTVKFSNVSALDVTIKMIFIMGSLFAAWKSNTTVLEVINPEIAAADRASAAVMAGFVKMAAQQATQAAMAAATGGGSVAAGAAAKGAASAAGGAGSAAGSAGGASGALGGGGNAFKGGESAGGKMNLGGSDDKGGKGGSDDKGGKSGSDDKSAKGGSDDNGGKSTSADNGGKSGKSNSSSQKFNKAADNFRKMDLGSEDEDEEDKK
ncbi:MAG: Mbov_0396 family ICE element transmembrane protein [Oscillospiraceae bacterium]